MRLPNVIRIRAQIKIKNKAILDIFFFLFFFFFYVKLITLIHTKNKKVHPETPAAQYSLVFPQPKHFDLTSIKILCIFFRYVQYQN